MRPKVEVTKDTISKIVGPRESTPVVVPYEALRRAFASHPEDWVLPWAILPEVDAVVMAMAEALGARAIATLDMRDFAAVELSGRPQLWPRDL